MSEYNADVSCCKDSGFPPTTADPPVYRQADTILVFARNEKVDPVVADLLLECIVKQFIACTFQQYIPSQRGVCRKMENVRV